jgi:hypothetical protein
MVMLIIDSLFNRGKKKEQLLEERQAVLDKSIQKSERLQGANHDVQKNIIEIAWKNQQLNEELTKLVAENERTRNLLIDRENRIKEKNDEMEERANGVRKEEIIIESRNADVRRREQLAQERETTLNTELAKVKERESGAEILKTESEGEKAKYQKLYEDLENEKVMLEKLVEETNLKFQDADEKSAAAQSIFEKARTIDEEIKKRETEFEAERQKIEKSLLAKIDEYERRLEDLTNAKGIADDIKFDKSKEGQEAKIVVKEAIRQAKKALTDTKAKFEELDEKYSTGTFKGFSTPLGEIDERFEELKVQYEQVKEHISSNKGLPSSVTKILESIDDCIINADRSIKSWEFSEAFKHIVFGLTTCKNYELLLTILNDWSGEPSDEGNMTEDDEFVDWYEIMEVEPDASEERIKAQYRNLMKKYHPDKSLPDEMEENQKKAAKINQANEVLSDEEKRKQFDEQRKNRKQKQ